MAEEMYAHKRSEKPPDIILQEEGAMENGLSLNLGLTNQYLLPCAGGIYWWKGGARRSFRSFYAS